MYRTTTWLICFFSSVCILLLNVEGNITPQEGSCTSDANCAGSECCVGLMRRRFIFFHPSTGICQPLRSQGYSCSVFHDRDPANQQLHEPYCPCAEGLECRGTTIDKQTNQTIHHDPRCLPKERK